MMSTTNTPYSDDIQQITYQVVRENQDKKPNMRSKGSFNTSFSSFPGSSFFYDVDEVT